MKKSLQDSRHVSVYICKDSYFIIMHTFTNSMWPLQITHNILYQLCIKLMKNYHSQKNPYSRSEFCRATFNMIWLRIRTNGKYWQSKSYQNETSTIFYTAPQWQQVDGKVIHIVQISAGSGQIDLDNSKLPFHCRPLLILSFVCFCLSLYQFKSSRHSVM